MSTLAVSAAGLPLFLLYFVLGAVLTVLFAAAYSRLTNHDELTLIREGNVSASVAFGGSLLGFSIPLDKAIAQAASVQDCLLWATVALLVQLAIYGAFRLLVPGLSNRIEENRLSVALFMAFVSIAGGMLNAASMTLYPGGG
jgi:putative membrane protein